MVIKYFKGFLILQLFGKQRKFLRYGSIMYVYGRGYGRDC